MGIFIIGCRDNTYRLLYNRDKYSTGTEEEYSRIEDIRDLNGNGLLEIVIVDGYTFSQQSDVRFSYEVIEWGGNSFRSLLDWGWELNMGFPLEFRDVDGNGTTESSFSEPFNIHCGIGPGWGPQRDAKNIFMWNGAQYEYVWRDPRRARIPFSSCF